MLSIPKTTCVELRVLVRIAARLDHGAMRARTAAASTSRSMPKTSHTHPHGSATRSSSSPQEADGARSAGDERVPRPTGWPPGPWWPAPYRGTPRRRKQRIGGWKTPSMFKRYDIVDERDLRDAGERLSTYLATETTAAPTVVPLRRRS